MYFKCGTNKGIAIQGHLTEDEMTYFVKWFRLVMLEAGEEAASHRRGRPWTKTSGDREDERKCFRDMCIQVEVKKGTIPQYSYWSLYIFSTSTLTVL